MTLDQYFGTSAAGLTLGLAVAGLFWKADDGISPEFRDWLAAKLMRARVRETSEYGWIVTFLIIFDGLFGERHISIRCFLRSALASTLATIVVVLVGWNIYGSDLIPDETGVGAATLFSVYFVVNVAGDYVSLLETRIVLNHAAANVRVRAAVKAILVDAILTFLVFLAAVWVGLLTAGMLVLLIQGQDGWLSLMPQEVVASVFQRVLADLPGVMSLSAQDSDMNAFGVMFHTTFFTSIWLWIFLLGVYLLRMLARFDYALAVVRWCLPISTHPLRAIGEFAGGSVCVGYYVVSLLR